MCKSFYSAIGRVFGDQVEVIDRFHVVQQAVGALDGVLRSVKKQRLFARFEAGPKSFHRRPLCVFDGCVHFEDHMPSAESA
jgi:transposase